MAGSIEYVAAAPTLQSMADLAEERKQRQLEADGILAQARRICEDRGAAHDIRCLNGYRKRKSSSRRWPWIWRRWANRTRNRTGGKSAGRRKRSCVPRRSRR